MKYGILFSILQRHGLNIRLNVESQSHSIFHFFCRTNTLAYYGTVLKTTFCTGQAFGWNVTYPSISGFQVLAMVVLHSSVGSWPYPQTLEQAGKACQGQTLQLLQILANYECKNIYNIVSGACQDFAFQERGKMGQNKDSEH